MRTCLPCVGFGGVLWTAALRASQQTSRILSVASALLLSMKKSATSRFRSESLIAGIPMLLRVGLNLGIATSLRELYVFYAVFNFRALGVVKAIDSTDQVAGDSTDTLKFNTFTNLLLLFHAVPSPGAQAASHVFLMIPSE